MKKILAPLFALAIVSTGCSTAADVDRQNLDTKPVSTEVAVPVTAAADAEWDAPEFAEVPEVAEASPTEAWEAWDASGAAETLDNGGKVTYVESTPDAHVFAVEAPAAPVEVVEVAPAAPAAPEVIYEEAVPNPTICFQDDPSCPVPSPQDWVRHLTGNNSIVVTTVEGTVTGSTCNTLTEAICVVNGSYYMSQTKVRGAGYVPDIMAALG